MEIPIYCVRYALQNATQLLGQQKGRRSTYVL